MTVQEMIQEKKEWRALQARAKALPKDYYTVYKEMLKYLFKIGGTDFEALIELFEQSAADGLDVLEVTGQDVAAFCDELAKSGPYYEFLQNTTRISNHKTAETLMKSDMKVNAAVEKVNLKVAKSLEKVAQKYLDKQTEKEK